MKKVIHIIFLLVALHTHAQQPVYRHLTEDDGLPDNEIYYLYQDKAGFIWISTNSGLCRYNGQSFQYFSNPQLKAKSTGCIKEDIYGRIWAINFSGQIFYVQNDSLVIVRLPGIENLNSLAPFAIGPNNELAVSSAAKSETIIYKPLHFKKNSKPQYVLDTIITNTNGSPYYDSKGFFWATNGIVQNSNSQIVKYQHKETKLFSITGGQSTTNANNYVFEFNDHIYSYAREYSKLFINNGTAFIPYRTLKIPGFKSVEPLKNGMLAFCTNSGLFISDEKKQNEFIVNRLFEGQTISAFCEDNRGNWWVGTLTEGVYFIPKQGLNKIICSNPGVDYNNITTICTGPGNKLILGFLNGELGSLDKTLNYQTLRAANPFSNKTQSVFYSPQLQLLNWNADKIYQAHFSETDKNIQPYQGVGYSSKDMVYIPKWNAALIANPVDIQLTSLDKEFITKKVSNAWSKNYDTTTVFNNTQSWPQQSILLSKERGRAVYFDEKTETLWGADKNGITLYRENNKTNILWNGEPVYATSFCEQGDIIWTGSFSQGLINIKNEKAIKQFTVKDGLASNTIYKIIGSGNHLWIYTDKGVQYFDIENEKFYLVDKTIGLPSYKINGMALVGDYLFISTPKGLLSVADSIRFESPENNKVFFQSVYCNGNIVDISKTNFATGENDFVFKTETPAYSNRALLRYRYRLKGADKDFITVGLDMAVFEYKSLQPGNYTFELTLTDARGKTIGEPIAYSFYINPPFYKTVWFIVLCFLLLALLVYFGVRSRINRIKKRGNEKLALAKLESDLKQSQLSGIKAQMNPHFMFNALNSIQEFILLNDKKQANMYMGKFADLMRMTLDMSNKNEVLLEEEIKTIQLYLELEALRFEEGFSYTLRVDNNVDRESIHLPAMLIQPNIENAVKHGLLHKAGDKKLDIHFFIQNSNTVCCTVTDNGIGRIRSGEINAQRLRKHTSFATGATQKRLELLNHDRKQLITIIYEDLHDDHGNPNGTKVTINIPLQ